MKHTLLLLGLLLTACSTTVTVDLPNQTLDLPGLADSGGQTIYRKDGLSFNPPPVDVIRGVRVEGVLEASQPLNLTLEFYARTQDPQRDSSCQALPSFPLYLCPVGPEDEKVGEARFQNGRETPLILQGAKLTQGVRAGKFWLGAKASGLPSTPIKLTFRNMKAYVTLGL